MSSTDEQGYFAADTRLVSGYRLKLGRGRLVLINSAAVAHHAARFEFTNPATSAARTASGCPRTRLHLRLDRSIGTGIHEDYDLTNYSSEPVQVDLEVSIESDFADLFEVKDHRPLLRGTLHSSWDGQRLSVGYQNDQFERGLVIEPLRADSQARYANGGLLFRIELAPRQQWHTCLLWRPVLETGIGTPPELLPRPDRRQRSPRGRARMGEPGDDLRAPALPW